ncbi:MAG: ATP-binding protein [Bacteroidales bacterium]|jgi:DNA mismatch repair ATPase MutL|nr:ATP-binding protein [Bacteroidales bacterium]MDD4383593.1 ATP-binding protein [Bacteroidales bacterium]MDY0197336.1 ATP-binding protein [Tenuifilaceae bacterium]
MKELSLHILDIAQNSIVAGAKKIGITIDEDTELDILTIELSDDGKGMKPEVVAKVIDPYTTSRTTRKVGLGLPLLNDACKNTGGKLHIESELGKGTKVIATLGLNHIDRQPLGDITGVVVMLIAANPNIRFVYTHIKNKNEFVLDTNEVNEILEGIPINTPEVGKMLKEMISSNLEEL